MKNTVNPKKGKKAKRATKRAINTTKLRKAITIKNPTKENTPTSMLKKKNITKAKVSMASIKRKRKAKRLKNTEKVCIKTLKSHFSSNLYKGKNHKKGHSTHGEHNIVKKNEYIKSTKFYDEDHDDGEAEEHSEYQGLHSEKEGGKKEGGHKKKGYHKEGKAKKGHHDKGHQDEEHGGFEKDEGGEDFYGHEESFSEKKGKKHSKKWQKE